MTQEPLVREAEVAAFRDAVLTKLTYAVGKDPDHAFDHDWFEAIALAARDHMVEHWMEHTRQIYRKGQKRVYYLSLEFLIGRLLYDSLSNLGLLDVAREALTELGVDLERIRLLEPDEGRYAEIGREIGRTERTVELKMRQIREVLGRDSGVPGEPDGR